MARDKNEKKKLILKKITIWNLDHRVNVLEKGVQKYVKGGETEAGTCDTGDTCDTINDCHITGTTKYPAYCAPITV